MPRKVTPSKIYRQRRDNYCFHFEQRQLFKAVALELQLLYEKWSATLPRPILNAWGAGIYSEAEWTQVVKLAVDKNLPDGFLLVPWYVSDQGWEIFQTDWQNLPDVIHFPPQEPLWTNVYNSGVVHIPTWEKVKREELIPKKWKF